MITKIDKQEMLKAAQEEIRYHTDQLRQCRDVLDDTPRSDELTVANLEVLITFHSDSLATYNRHYNEVRETVAI